MSRNIYCYRCKDFLGEIHDAHLKKGIRYICALCNGDSNSNDDKTVDNLKRMFGVKD